MRLVILFVGLIVADAMTLLPLLPSPEDESYEGTAQILWGIALYAFALDLWKKS